LGWQLPRRVQQQTRHTHHRNSATQARSTECLHRWAAKKMYISSLISYAPRTNWRSCLRLRHLTPLASMLSRNDSICTPHFPSILFFQFSGCSQCTISTGLGCEGRRALHKQQSEEGAGFFCHLSRSTGGATHFQQWVSRLHGCGHEHWRMRVGGGARSRENKHNIYAGGVGTAR